tara:strand:+ start:67 stop:450 length:384 start_codon:yes stop_codon:yes gene_type:complete
MLIGILLSQAKMDFLLERSNSAYMGYRVRLKLNIRAEESFLLAIQRSLLQHSISSKFHKVEHKSRPKPILKIGGIKNLYKICSLVPKELPDSKNEWPVLRKLVGLISDGEHRTADGFDKILELKGLI